MSDLSVRDELASLLSLFPLRPTTEGPAQLAPYLFLGSAQHAKDPRTLSALHITDVINCAEEEVGIEHYDALKEAGIQCSGFNSCDSADYLMVQHYPQVLALVSGVKQRCGVCLVHCVAGVNRSGFLAIALLCALEGQSLIQAATWARGQRGRVCTNRGFQQQLLSLAETEGWQLR